MLVLQRTFARFGEKRAGHVISLVIFNFPVYLDICENYTNQNLYRFDWYNPHLYNYLQPQKAKSFAS